MMMYAMWIWRAYDACVSELNSCHNCEYEPYRTPPYSHSFLTWTKSMFALGKLPVKDLYLLIDTVRSREDPSRVHQGACAAHTARLPVAQRHLPRPTVRSRHFTANNATSARGHHWAAAYRGHQGWEWHQWRSWERRQGP